MIDRSFLTGEKSPSVDSRTSLPRRELFLLIMGKHNKNQLPFFFLKILDFRTNLWVTGQDRTGQDKTRQDRTGQDKTGQVRTGLYQTYLDGLGVCPVKLNSVSFSGENSCEERLSRLQNIIAGFHNQTEQRYEAL